MLRAGFLLNIGTLNDIEIRNDKLLLSSLSKITDEDAEHIMQLEAFIDGFLSDDFLEFLIDLKKGHCNKFEVVDYLRSKGYAIPFMEYSIEDLISFGWVQLL